MPEAIYQSENEIASLRLAMTREQFHITRLTRHKPIQSALSQGGRPMNILKQQFCGDLGIFYEDRAVVDVRGEWFHILASGEPAYPERYAFAEYFQNGLAWVKEKNGRWKVIDRHGKEVRCEHALPFNQR